MAETPLPLKEGGILSQPDRAVYFRVANAIGQTKIRDIKGMPHEEFTLREFCGRATVLWLRAALGCSIGGF